MSHKIGGANFLEMTMRLYRRGALLGIAGLTGLTLMACAPQKFSGNNGGRAGAEAKPKPQPQVEPPAAPPPSVEQECVEARLIKVRSLKTAVDQRQYGSSVDVELTFEPCPAQKTNLQLPIFFDFDGNISFGSSGTGQLSYQLLVGGTQAGSGMMNFIEGADLFGKIGSEYGRFESSQPMQVSPKITLAVLKLYMSGVKVLGPTNSTQDATTNFSVPLHVRVGRSTPVTGTVTFTPP